MTRWQNNATSAWFVWMFVKSAFLRSLVRIFGQIFSFRLLNPLDSCWCWMAMCNRFGLQTSGYDSVQEKDAPQRLGGQMLQIFIAKDIVNQYVSWRCFMLPWMAPIFEGFDHETNWDLSTESEDISHQECGRLNDAFPSIPCGELLCEPYDIGVYHWVCHIIVAALLWGVS